MIYVIEFERSLGNPQHRNGTAKFYVGYCEDDRIEQRLQEHRRGDGAAITRAAVHASIDFKVVMTIPGDRKVERQLKRQKNTPRIVRRFREGKVWQPKA